MEATRIGSRCRVPCQCCGRRIMACFVGFGRRTARSSALGGARGWSLPAHTSDPRCRLGSILRSPGPVTSCRHVLMHRGLHKARAGHRAPRRPDIEGSSELQWGEAVSFLRRAHAGFAAAARQLERTAPAMRPRTDHFAAPSNQTATRRRMRLPRSHQRSLSPPPHPGQAPRAPLIYERQSSRDDPRVLKLQNRIGVCGGRLLTGHGPQRLPSPALLSPAGYVVASPMQIAAAPPRRPSRGKNASPRSLSTMQAAARAPGSPSLPHDAALSRAARPCGDTPSHFHVGGERALHFAKCFHFAPRPCQARARRIHRGGV